MGCRGRKSEYARDEALKAQKMVVKMKAILRSCAPIAA
jgi:hypothetical protein